MGVVLIRTTALGNWVNSVNIYHTSVDINNLIAAGLSRTDITTGYCYDNTGNYTTFIVASDCGTTASYTYTPGATPAPTPPPEESIAPVTPTPTPTPTATPAPDPCDSATTLIAAVDGYTNPTTNGGTDGTITFNFVGGLAPYSYTLYKDSVSYETDTTSNTTISFTDLSAGEYYISVDESCSTSDSTEVTTLSDPPAVIQYSLRVGDIDGNSTVNINGVDYQLTVEDHQENYLSTQVGDSFTSAIGSTTVYSPNEELFSITDVTATDNFGNVYTTSVSSFGPTDGGLGPNGYEITVTGNYITPDTGNQVVIDLDITTSTPAYTEEVHYLDLVDNAVMTVGIESPSTATLEQTNFTASFAGQDGGFYTASFTFTPNNNYTMAGANIQRSLTAGNPDADLNFISSTTTDGVTTILYGSEIGANDAFARLEFEGTAIYDNYIDNALDVDVEFRTPSFPTWTTYYNGADREVVNEINVGANTTQLDIRIIGHDGRYQLAESSDPDNFVNGIFPALNNSLDTVVHSINLLNNDGSGTLPRTATIRLSNPSGEIAQRLNITFTQDGTQ